MEFGVFLEFECPGERSETQAFDDAFELVDAAEAMGLDAVWLAELHIAPGRSVLASPLIIAGAIAARTRRIKIGTAVQILPLCHPLRLAEDVATIDHVSHGRLIFGVGRSGFPRSYEAYGVAYTESRDRFAEVLDVVKAAWTQPTFSYSGTYYTFRDVCVTPKPYQRPHPPIRVAASSPETFVALGKAGYDIFAAARIGTLSELAPHIGAYHCAYAEAGHPGAGQVFLRVPVYVAETREQALAEPEASVMQFYRAFSERVGTLAERAESARRLRAITYEDVLREKIVVGTPEMVVDRLRELQAELGLGGILAELNCGNLIPQARVRKSLQLLCEEVMPRFEYQPSGVSQQPGESAQVV
jgi:alkanesulfonate monooxygenase SsuD/methylene tetrahydromethanopterin reductase-like flavin-dependent oxidoreductase (luciferase family)